MLEILKGGSPSSHCGPGATEFKFVTREVSVMGDNCWSTIFSGVYIMQHPHIHVPSGTALVEDLWHSRKWFSVTDRKVGVLLAGLKIECGCI